MIFFGEMKPLLECPFLSRSKFPKTSRFSTICVNSKVGENSLRPFPRMKVDA